MKFRKYFLRKYQFYFGKLQETALAERKTATGAEHLHEGYCAQHENHCPDGTVSVEQLSAFGFILCRLHIFFIMLLRKP